MEFLFESVTTNLLLFFIFLFSLLYYYSISTFDYWTKRGVKYVKPLPFIGNNKNMLLRRKHRAFELDDIYKANETEQYVGIFQFRKPMLLVRDPNLIHSILTTDFSNFVDTGFFQTEKIDKLSWHLLSLTGTKWRNLRRKLTPVFSSGKLKNMLDELKTCTAELGIALDHEGDIIDIRKVMANFSTRVIGSIAFGCQFNSLTDPNSEFVRRSQALFTITVRTIAVILMDVVTPKIRRFFRIKRMTKVDEDYFLNFVKDTVTYRDKNNVIRNDFLQLLMNLRTEDSSAAKRFLELEDKENNSEESEIILDDKILASNVFIFFLAGYETTSSTLSHCLLELAANPDVQQKLRDETLTAFKKNNNNVTYDVVRNMTYLEKVLSETLRKYPVVVSLGRRCTKAYKIPGSDIVLDEGVLISIPVYSIHNDPQYYPEPEVFDPERFSEENQQNRRNGTYLPFGDGPRSCIGMRFAFLEMKVAIAYMISRYQFTLTNKMAYPIEFSTTSVFLTPRDGIWLRVEKIAQ